MKYTAISAFLVVVSQILLFILYGILRAGSATTCNLITTALTAVPSYYLNRRWAWGKSGKSHFMKEILPFWVLTFAGLGLSLIAVALAHRLAVHLHASHLVDAIFVNGASLSAFGVLWVGKFMIFNKLLFAHDTRVVTEV